MRAFCIAAVLISGCTSVNLDVKAFDDHVRDLDVPDKLRAECANLPRLKDCMYVSANARDALLKSVQVWSDQRCDTRIAELEDMYARIDAVFAAEAAALPPDSFSQAGQPVFFGKLCPDDPPLKPKVEPPLKPKMELILEKCKETPTKPITTALVCMIAQAQLNIAITIANRQHRTVEIVPRTVTQTSLIDYSPGEALIDARAYAMQCSGPRGWELLLQQSTQSMAR